MREFFCQFVVCSYRYGHQVLIGDQLLIPGVDELSLTEVINISHFHMQGTPFMWIYCILSLCLEIHSSISVYFLTKTIINASNFQKHFPNPFNNIFQGLFAPLTAEGNIVVGGVLASCHADVDHDLAQISITPLKWFPGIIQWIFGDDKEHPIFVKMAEILREFCHFQGA